MATPTGPGTWTDQVRGEGCPTCAEGRPDDDGHGRRWFAGPAADAYLQREAVTAGYSTVVFRGRHVADLVDLDDGELAAFWTDVRTVARALRAVYAPVHLNHSVLGNEVPHLHVHVVARYADDPAPRRPLPPEAWAASPRLTEDELAAQVGRLRAALAGRGHDLGPGAAGARGAVGVGGVVVRSAAPADVGALRALLAVLYDAPPPADGAGPGRAGELLEAILGQPRRDLLVAELDGVVVGTADLLVVTNLAHGGRPWAVVENVVVDPSARRHGVARALIAEVRRRAAERGAYKLQLVSAADRAGAHALYEATGFAAPVRGFRAYLDPPAGAGPA